MWLHRHEREDVLRTQLGGDLERNMAGGSRLTRPLKLAWLTSLNPATLGSFKS
jgi:hypothetical protein